MTDHDDESIRRLLASSRVDEPMPPEVVDRLDDVLASLVAERTEKEAPVDLSAERSLRRHRRRRVGLSIAAAAAAVVVAGVGIPQLLNTTDSSQDASTAADRASSSDADMTVLASESLTEDVTAFVRTLDDPTAPRGYASSDRTEPEELSERTDGDGTANDETRGPMARARPADPDSQCGWTGPGEVYAVLYDGEPADLVLRRGAGGRLIARIVICDGGATGAEATVARTVVLPAGVRSSPTTSPTTSPGETAGP